MRLLDKKKFSADIGLLTSGALCRIRPRLRNTAISFPPFPPGGEGRWQRPRSEAFTVEFVDGRVHPGHAEKPSVERLFEHRGHLVELGVGRVHAIGRCRGRGRGPRYVGPNARAWN